MRRWKAKSAWEVSKGAFARIPSAIRSRNVWRSAKSASVIRSAADAQTSGSSAIRRITRSAISAGLSLVMIVFLFGVRTTRPVCSSWSRASRTVFWLTPKSRAREISRKASPGWYLPATIASRSNSKTCERNGPDFSFWSSEPTEEGCIIDNNTVPRRGSLSTASGLTPLPSADIIILDNVNGSLWVSYARLPNVVFPRISTFE